MNIIKTALLALAAFVVAGCTNVGNQVPPPGLVQPDGTNLIVKAVLVGVENGWAGPCPGALKDVDTMKSVLSKAGVGSVEILKDKNATVRTVSRALTNALDADLVVFFYSGHGGSQPATSKTKQFETDGNDEYICLYDNGMLDDDIWSLVENSGKRVFMVFDCCHSETMFRSPKMTLKNAAGPKISNLFGALRGTVSLQCWSGCPDDTYSYGSTGGGEFTNALNRHFVPGMTYDELWSAVKSDQTLKMFEDSRRTVVGDDFGAMPTFK